MRICFVGHAFHRRTRSNSFFLDLINQIGDVTLLYADPDGGPLANDDVIRSLLSHNFDCYIFWQTEWIAQHLLPMELENVFLVPMYDAVYGHSVEYWKRFTKHHVISFSRALHETVRSAGIESSYFQYFVDPGDAEDRQILPQNLDGFFWERRPLSPLCVDRVLIQSRMLGIQRLNVHKVPDFPSDADKCQPRESDEQIEVHLSTWFDDRADFADAAGRPLFFFVPREREGIGMATLEAMARGQIVVAPNLGTTNDYVAHLVSGLLYEPARPMARLDLPRLDVAALTAMSRAARRKVVEGRKVWLGDIDRLNSLLLNDGRRWPTGDSSSRFAAQIRRSAHARAVTDVR